MRMRGTVAIVLLVMADTGSLFAQETPKLLSGDPMSE